MFTRDCEEKPFCKYVADASCRCNFGSCVLTGGYPFGVVDKECVSYEDCPCKYVLSTLAHSYFKLSETTEMNVSVRIQDVTQTSGNVMTLRIVSSWRNVLMASVLA